MSDNSSTSDYNNKEYRKKIRMISANINNKMSAGEKAPSDIERILETEYSIKIERVSMKKCKNKILLLFRKIAYCSNRLIKLLRTNKNDIYIIQSNFFHYPFIFYKLNAYLIRKITAIIIIHDVGGLRSGNEKFLKKELYLFNSAKKIIVHNEKMKELFCNNGIEENKIHVLECFDYICDSKNLHEKSEKPIICFAGNFNKSPFIYQLEDNKMNFQLNLYGVGIEKNISNKICYCGKYNSDILPSKLEGNFGLIWDGNYNETDENEGLKYYTKYNNPHKLSCYIAAGLPVIVWKKSAIADFVEKYNIGYTISNIYDINNINFGDYKEKINNVQILSKRVKEGYFTKRVMDEIFNQMV